MLKQSYASILRLFLVGLFFFYSDVALADFPKGSPSTARCTSKADAEPMWSLLLIAKDQLHEIQGSVLIQTLWAYVLATFLNVQVRTPRKVAPVALQIALN